ncbi:la-related protein 7 isoform X2 [Prorops nasuta]
MELDSERVPVPQMQRSLETAPMELSNENTNRFKRKPRFRKKALHAAILKQMEFYFSDANLSKDRFLSNLVKDDPNIDIEVFTRFNKIRELTTSTSRIAKALQASNMLSLSADGTKVCRITPIKQKENVDECTVYVQGLPPDADHEWISSIFSCYGSIAYISIPKYKSNKKIKGFAFIEFDVPQSAMQCIEAFRKKGFLLPFQTAPDELLSIKTFENAETDDTVKENPLCTQGAMNSDSSEISTETFKEPEEHCDKIKKGKKRKHKEINNIIADELERKKELKTDNGKEENQYDSNETITDKALQESTDKKKKRKLEIVPETIETNMAMEESNINENGNNEKKKKKRKRRNKTEEGNNSIGLQVMPKKQWKQLRNKYLDLQRSKMRQLKQDLRKTKWNQWYNTDKHKIEKDDTEGKEKGNKADISSTCRFSFIPGVIVKIHMVKPCKDPSSFKNELKGNSNIKYIDVSIGSYEAYIRCDSAEAAILFAEKSNSDKQFTVLQGEEEKIYWDKILQDRETKLSGKIKVKQRGREKLLKKAEKALGKHIKFEEV